jgi:hypothetical protein
MRSDIKIVLDSLGIHRLPFKFMVGCAVRRATLPTDGDREAGRLEKNSARDRKGLR